MNLRYIIKSTLVAVPFILAVSSCASWLEVDMEDSIMENSLFDTNEGYLTALNGVYAEMNGVYGSDLSMGTIDVMAQYYTPAADAEHSYNLFSAYKYEEDKLETTSNTIWTKQYSLIANLNVLLEHCDAADATIKSKYYPIVKGEALALRAMLHFDLLRLYGPIYSSETAATLVMPYQETSSKDIQPLRSAQEVLDKVMIDLRNASTLLKDADPIITQGILNSSGTGNEDNSLRYRQFRLNYYAVQLLLARAYLWGGNKADAYRVAHDIITTTKANSESATFAWVKKVDALNVDTPDRMYSPEVIFSLYNMKRVTNFKSLFSSAVKLTSRLTFVGENVADKESKVSTFYDDENDIRRTMWSADVADEAGGAKSSLSFAKYEDFTDKTGTKSFRYMIPLMRLSEVYLIAAECTSDRKEAIGYINAIRLNRSCRDIELDESVVLQDYITKELAREVIGEGQLFFYYKRLGMEQIASGTSSTETYNMTLANYVWPMAKVERDLRLTSK